MILKLIKEIYRHSFKSDMFISGGGSAGGYVIERSLRFSSASSQYLTRTPVSAGNRKTWTWSGWVKHSAINASNVEYTLFSTYTGNSDSKYIIAYFYNGLLRLSGFNTIWRQTTQLFRDPSAYSHIVITVDTTNAVANDRIKVDINGTQITSYSLLNNPALNADLAVNQAGQHAIGTDLYAGPLGFLDGYQAEINFIDGQAITPSSFGEVNPSTGQWVAKKYTGTYGTNGFYLDFKDGTSTTTLGYDKSGNGNNWTLTNFTRSAGVNDCWMKDVPAGNGSASAVQPSGNYAVLNNLTPIKTSISGANLRSGTGDTWSNSTIPMTSGKWYAEYTITTLAVVQWVGVGRNNPVASQYNGGLSADYSYCNDGLKYNNGSSVAYGTTYTSGDVIGVAYDADNATLTFYKNGVSQGTAYTSLPVGEYYFQCYGRTTGGSSVVNANFGQRTFTYTPPAGFKALCTANLTSTDVIESGSFTGNASADGPFILCNGTPETLTINGNAVTWGTHADRLSNGFKLRTSSSSYNSSGTNTWTATVLSPESKSAFKYQNAKGN